MGDQQRSPQVSPEHTSAVMATMWPPTAEMIEANHRLQMAIKAIDLVFCTAVLLLLVSLVVMVARWFG